LPRLFLLWSAESADTSWLGSDGGRCLVFDPLGADVVAAHGVEPVLADDLLDWDTRAAVELKVAELLAALRSRVGARADVAGGDDLPRAAADLAEYELRFEWTALLCAHAAASRVSAGYAAVVPQPGTPSAILAGVQAATGHWAGAPRYWRPVVEPPPPRRLAHAVADAVVAARAVATPRRSIRLLALPAMRIITALAPLEPAELREAGLAVGVFPGLTHGDPLRLVVAKRLPAFVPAPGRSRPAAPPEVGPTGEPGLLDAALRAAGDRMLARAAAGAAAARRALRSMESLSELRAVLLPTTALGAARLVRDWAALRGLRIGVVQHGMYAFRDWDGGDRLADVIYGWGPGVASQVAAWGAPPPTVEVVGAPGLPHRSATHRSAPTVSRVMVASTHPNLGTAFTPWGFRWAFLGSLGAGLRILGRAGAAVTLRPHPSEPHVGYERILDALGLDGVKVTSAGVFGEVASDYDVVICPPSSAAVEAAAVGVPVLLWTGGQPGAIRRRFLVPPLSEELPGSFADGPEFDRLARQAVETPDALLSEARSLSERLLAYAEPYEPRRLANQLRKLGE
jgi:hypothetical protein